MDKVTNERFEFDDPRQWRHGLEVVPAEVADKLLQAVQELRVLVEDIASDEEMDGEAGTVLRRAEDAVKQATQPGG